MRKKDFQKKIWRYYKKYRRSFPWRNTKNPYNILVSEIMLQQTQAHRVIPKYQEFLSSFPTLKSLARAPFKRVLQLWKGLGYNRRALYLKKTTEIILKEYKGVFPREKEKLLKLPGVGEATAGDIRAFAWNLPAVVIETNIRSVFIHFFFKNKNKVSDKEIIPLIQETLPQGRSREWYYALMDYGAYLKETENPSVKSMHYKKQSTFKGSNRELRSSLLQFIIEHTPIRKEKVVKSFPKYPKKQILVNLNKMSKEGLISESKEVLKI